MNINCDIKSINRIIEFKYLVLILNFERKIQYINKKKIEYRKKSFIFFIKMFSGIFIRNCFELFINNVL